MTFKYIKTHWCSSYHTLWGPFSLFIFHVLPLCILFFPQYASFFPDIKRTNGQLLLVCLSAFLQWWASRILQIKIQWFSDLTSQWEGCGLKCSQGPFDVEVCMFSLCLCTFPPDSPPHPKACTTGVWAKTSKPLAHLESCCVAAYLQVILEKKFLQAYQCSMILFQYRCVSFSQLSSFSGLKSPTWIYFIYTDCMIIGHWGCECLHTSHSCGNQIKINVSSDYTSRICIDVSIMLVWLDIAALE